MRKGQRGQRPRLQKKRSKDRRCAQARRIWPEVFAVGGPWLVESSPVGTAGRHGRPRISRFVRRGRLREGRLLKSRLVFWACCSGVVVILIAVLFPGLGSHPGGPRLQTRAALRAWQSALDEYKYDCSEYPSSAQSLNALLVDPGVSNWHGPYIEGDDIGIDPKDAWGTPLRYRLTQNGPTIASAGPDRVLGTKDDMCTSNELAQATTAKVVAPGVDVEPSP